MRMSPPTASHSLSQTCFQRTRAQRYFSTKAPSGDELDDSASQSSKLPDDQNSNGNTDLGLPGAIKGGKKLAIVFTCTVCGTRSAKQFSEQAYKHGVVLATCPGCNNKHLIADNLSMFDDTSGGWTIEKAMADTGGNFKAVTNDDVLELTMEDIVGKEKVEEIISSEAEAADGESSSSDKR